MFKLTAGGIVIVWLAGVILSLAVPCVLIYAAYHFITKFW